MEDFDMALPPSKVICFERENHNEYHYNLSGVIRETEQFEDLLFILMEMGESDFLHLHINCDGGSVYVANQIITRIRNCKGVVVGELEGMAASMGGQIFLSCHQHIVHGGSGFMSHTASTGSYSIKETDLGDMVDFTKKDVRERLPEIYDCFHTEEEMDRIFNGRDVYFTAKEVEPRLESYRWHRTDKYPSTYPAWKCGMDFGFEGEVEMGVADSPVQLEFDYEKLANMVADKLGSKLTNPPSYLNTPFHFTGCGYNGTDGKVTPEDFGQMDMFADDRLQKPSSPGYKPSGDLSIGD